MFKKAHIRIITIFFILGLVIITGLGIINIFNLNEIKTQIVGNSLNEIESKIEYTYKLTIILDVVYSVVCIIMIVLFSQILSRPITKLISDAEKMVSNDNKIEIR